MTEEIKALVKKHGIKIESGRCFGIKYHEAQGDLHKFIYELLAVLGSVKDDK